MRLTVGARELKTRLGRYLRLVREGATLIVTDRGRPVAELRPLSPAEGGLEEDLADLEALGEVTRGAGIPLPDREPVVLPGEPVSKTITRAREDRF
jgi:prevent-host-death family protein